MRVGAFGAVETVWTVEVVKVETVGFDRNCPCQTLKIRNVSLVVMGS
jgi:hypothetical protein